MMFSTVARGVYHVSDPERLHRHVGTVHKTPHGWVGYPARGLAPHPCGYSSVIDRTRRGAAQTLIDWARGEYR